MSPKDKVVIVHRTLPRVETMGDGIGMRLTSELKVVKEKLTEHEEDFVARQLMDAGWAPPVGSRWSAVKQFAEKWYLCPLHANAQLKDFGSRDWRIWNVTIDDYVDKCDHAGCQQKPIVGIGES